MRPPSLLRRLALVSVALGIPYVVHEAIQTLSAGLPASEDNNTTVDEVNDGDDDEGERRRRRQQLQRQKLLRDRLRVARQGVLQWAVPINLVFFYFFGSFYNLAKRVTGVRYVHFISSCFFFSCFFFLIIKFFFAGFWQTVARGREQAGLPCSRRATANPTCVSTCSSNFYAHPGAAKTRERRPRT